MPTPRKHADDRARKAAWRANQKLAVQAELAAKNIPASAVVPTAATPARWRALQARAVAALEAIQSEMQEVYEERSEKWKESDQATEWEAKTEAVADALAAVEELDL
jgi:hypothetical protein